MDMNKILAAGLIAAVASTASLAECGDGGFYVGLNAGLSFHKAKVKAEKHEYDAATNEYGYTGETVNDKGLRVEDANSRSDAFVKGMKKTNRKTNFAAELVLGYDFRMNDIMMGVDLTLGSTLGKNMLKYRFKGTDDDWNNGETYSGSYGRVKPSWHVGLMPRIGYLFTPEFEGYLTFGVKFVRLQSKTYNVAELNVKDDSGIPAIPPSMNKKSGMRVIPVVGAGVRYEFTPEMFAKLEYNFDFRTKAKLHKKTMPELKNVKVSAHTIKLGLGYRF